jgi:hypothetical protein
VVVLSLLLIGTSVPKKARWAHARSEVLAVADHPPARGKTRHGWFGTDPATMHANSSGTELITFEDSWDGLLYVPTGMPKPDRGRSADRPRGDAALVVIRHRPKPGGAVTQPTAAI